MLERADTSEVIDLNTLALPLYSVIYWASAPRNDLLGNYFVPLV